LLEPGWQAFYSIVLMASAGKRVVAGSGPKLGSAGKFEGEFKIQKNTPYLKKRLECWDKFYTVYQASLAKKDKKTIKIELPNGEIKEGKSFETTPMMIAQGISKNLADAALVAKLIYNEPVESLKQCVAADGDDSDEEDASAQESVLWDMNRPVEGSCRMELLKFDHAQAQDVFWHSSSHVLGQAMEREFGCHLTIGPALDNGFYYDGYFGSKKLGADDFKAIEIQAAAICKEQQVFERCILTKQEALELFSDNPFKVQLITNKVPDGMMTSC